MIKFYIVFQQCTIILCGGSTEPKTVKHTTDLVTLKIEEGLKNTRETGPVADWFILRTVVLESINCFIGLEHV